MPAVQKDFIVRNGIVVNTNLIFATGGQVGINTSTPGANLDVVGTANVSGNTYFGANVTVNGTLTFNTAPYYGPTMNIYLNQATGVLTANGGLTTNGVILTADGTVGAPSHSFKSDVTTGFYKSGATQVSLSLGNSQKWIYDSAAGATSNGPLLINGVLTANGNASVNGNMVVSANLTVSGTANVGAMNWSANVNAANNTLTQPVLKAWKENTQVFNNANGTITLDFSQYNVFWVLATANTTLAYTGLPANTISQTVTIYVRRLSPGGQSLTFPANTVYSGGSQPPQTTTTNALDIWSVNTIDAGASFVTSLAMKDVR